jgi:hypothetical protein
MPSSYGSPECHHTETHNKFPHDRHAVFSFLQRISKAFKGPKSVALVSLPSLKFVPPPSHFYLLKEIKLYGVRVSSNSIMVIPRGAENSQKSRIYIKILCLRSLKISKYHTQDPQILGATAKNLVARATWRAEFVHPSSP